MTIVHHCSGLEGWCQTSNLQGPGCTGTPQPSNWPQKRRGSCATNEIHAAGRFFGPKGCSDLSAKPCHCLILLHIGDSANMCKPTFLFPHAPDFSCLRILDTFGRPMVQTSSRRGFSDPSLGVPHSTPVAPNRGKVPSTRAPGKLEETGAENGRNLLCF